jgi:hypothetical protein
MRTLFLVGSILVVCLAWGCDDGATYPSGTGTASARGTSSFQSSPAIINILFSNGQGNLGAQSFSPSPSPQNQPGVVWHNNDSTTHHIVSDDGSLDTGDIAPGSTSAPQLPYSGGGRYHCTIHPTMVGTIMDYWD